MNPELKKSKHRPELEAFSQRLKVLINKLGIEQQAFAAAGDITPPTLTAYLKAFSQPSQDVLSNWVEKFEVDANWLLTGKGPMFRGERKEGAGPAYQITSLGHNGHVRRAEVVRGTGDVDLGYLIDVHAEAGAGPASMRWEPEAIASVCIPPDFYKPGVFGLRIKGKSMEPLISRDAFVGVDENDREFVGGDIYAVYIPHEGLRVKQIFLDPAAGEYVLHSVNPTHPDMRLSISDGEHLIVGRVVWVLQKF